VPADFVAETDGPVAALALVEDRIRDGNDPDWFRLGYGAFQEHFRYELVTSGERVRLHQRYGALFDGQISLSEGEVQGILSIADPDAVGYNTAEVFQRFTESGIMNRMR
jgi:hypothetical protein